MKLLIIGATSAIATETARNFAHDGAELFLVARNPEKLAAIASDLKVRGAQRVEIFLLDMTKLEQHQPMFDAALSALGSLDMLLVAYGTLGSQITLQQSAVETVKSMNENFVSVVSVLTIAANYFEQQKKGVIAVISSVAGDRGRQSVYVYGSAKAGLSAFLQGLRSRMFKVGVTVLTIKPGQVDSPMTSHMKKSLLFAKPATVGKDIYSAMKRRQDVLYTPWFWRFIMLIIMNIPEPIFKRLKM